jgi:hypothetical protein
MSVPFNKPSIVKFCEAKNKYTVFTHKNEVLYFDTYQSALEMSLECFLYYTERLEEKNAELEGIISRLINK